MTKELNNFTHRSKLDLIKMYKKCRRDIRRLSRQKIELEKLLEEEKKLNAEIKARFVKCNTCTDEMKSKCLMFSENLCEGERCEELVDLMALVSQSDLQKENEQLKQHVEKMKCCYNCSKWDDGECEESPKSKTFFCADFKCDKWESE